MRSKCKVKTLRLWQLFPKYNVRKILRISLTLYFQLLKGRWGNVPPTISRQLFLIDIDQNLTVIFYEMNLTNFNDSFIIVSFILFRDYKKRLKSLWLMQGTGRVFILPVGECLVLLYELLFMLEWVILLRTETIYKEISIYPSRK